MSHRRSYYIFPVFQTAATHNQGHCLYPDLRDGYDFENLIQIVQPLREKKISFEDAIQNSQSFYQGFPGLVIFFSIETRRSGVL
jgi:hypothetical protein